MKRFRTLLVIFFIAALVLFISSCWPMLPSISLTIQGSNRGTRQADNGRGNELQIRPERDRLYLET